MAPPQDPRWCARRVSQSGNRRLEQFLAIGADRAMLSDQFRRHLRVRVKLFFAFAAVELSLPPSQHPLPHARGAFDLDVPPQLLVLHRRNLDVNVDAIEQRPGNLRNVALKSAAASSGIREWRRRKSRMATAYLITTNAMIPRIFLPLNWGIENGSPGK
jgi:hypothetical protein